CCGARRRKRHAGIRPSHIQKKSVSVGTSREPRERRRDNQGRDACCAESAGTANTATSSAALRTLSWSKDPHTFLLSRTPRGDCSRPPKVALPRQVAPNSTTSDDAAALRLQKPRVQSEAITGQREVVSAVVLLRDTHRIRAVRLGVVAHPESTCLEFRFDLFFGETVVITAVGHVVTGFQGFRASASKRSNPLRQPEASVLIGRWFLSDPERDEDWRLGWHQGAELSQKCDSASAPGDAHVRRPANDEAVVRSEFRPQFRWHVIRRTEHDVCWDAEFLQEPPAGFDKARSAVKATRLEPKTVQSD